MLAALSFAATAPKPKPKAPQASLATAAGTVTIESRGKRRAGKEGDLLKDGDAVSTGLKSLAVIDIGDGSMLKLRESSRVLLELGDRSTGALLSDGGVFAQVAKRALGSLFQIRTPTAVASVRGTQFFTAYGRQGKSGKDLWVCVNEGAVQVNTDAAKAPILVPAGKGVLIKSGLDLTAPQAYDWTKKLNWGMDAAKGSIEDRTSLDKAYSDLLDQDYR